MNWSCKHLLVAALFTMVTAWAHAGLVFAVNEGVSYRVPNEEIRARYAAIAVDLTRILKQPVTIEPVGSYAELRKGLANKTFDIALVHPAHVSIGAIRQTGYRLVAVTKGYENYHATFLVNSNSKMTSLADVKDKRLASPDEDSITAWIVRASVRDAIGSQALGKRVDYNYTRYQEAVPFMVENGFTATGATASSAVVKEWVGKGGKVLAESKPVPIKNIVVSPTLPADQVEKLRDYLLGLDKTSEGRDKLRPTTYLGFVSYDQTALLAIGNWLGI